MVNYENYYHTIIKVRKYIIATFIQIFTRNKIKVLLYMINSKYLKLNDSQNSVKLL